MKIIHKKTGKQGELIQRDGDRVLVQYGKVQMWGKAENFDIEEPRAEVCEPVFCQACIAESDSLLRNARDDRHPVIDDAFIQEIWDLFQPDPGYNPCAISNPDPGRICDQLVTPPSSYG